MSLEGKQIERYHILRLLGSGGMGDVYLAEDPRIGQQVAIKVVRTELSTYPDEQAVQDVARLFQREAKAIVKLDHPHILPLYNYGEEHISNRPLIYLVMPYRPEGSLTDWLRRRESKELLAPSDIARLVSQAADALQHAHDHDIIHQDVKPSNFLVRVHHDAPLQPDVLLSDFGIARLTTATSSISQSVRGTPAYMASEQWEGEPVPATDQYALAVMTYELLTGKMPFQGGPGKMMYHHINTQPQPPSSFNPRLSSDIDVVLLHALTKQPDQRFASINAFANALQQAVQRLSVQNMVALPSATLEEGVSPVVINESEMMATTLARSDVQRGGSDSETYVTPGETPASPVTPAIAVSQSEQPSKNTPLPVGAGSQQRKRRPLLIFAILTLVFVLMSGGLATALPRFGGNSSTVVSITPAYRTLSNSFTLTTLPGNIQMGVRFLSAPLSVPAQTVTATGMGTIPATHATGLLGISEVCACQASVPAGTVYSDTWAGGSGADFVTDIGVTFYGTSGATVPAHALQAGTIGNIPAGGLHEPRGIWHITAATAFTGGQNAGNYTFVQQSDIDAVTRAVERANTPNPQNRILPLVHTNERLIGSPTCKPTVTPDHNVGDKATQVTVSVTFACSGEVYDYNGTMTLAAQLLTHQADTQLGNGYAPVGSIKTTLTSATVMDAKSGKVRMVVATQGRWTYQFTNVQKQALARLIAGKTKSEAQRLLSSQAGVGQVVITLTSGNSDTLPTDVRKITINVSRVI